MMYHHKAKADPDFSRLESESSTSGDGSDEDEPGHKRRRLSPDANMAAEIALLKAKDTKRVDSESQPRYDPEAARKMRRAFDNETRRLIEKGHMDTAKFFPGFDAATLMKYEYGEFFCYDQMKTKAAKES